MTRHPDLTQDQYYKAFGLFMYRFASIEAALHSLCRHIIGLPEKRARVITAGMRLADIIALTRRMAKARKLPAIRQTELEAIFTHVSDISALRDSLAHRGGTVVKGAIVSSNARTVRFREDTEVLTVNISHIEAATIDLIGVYLRIVWVMRPRNWKPENVADIRRPWLYKPVRPTTPYRRKKANSPSRARRPRASTSSP